MLTDDLRLDGKVALVTGASKGIGATLAVAYAEMGADVALLARDREGLDAVAARVESHGRKALVLPADVTDLDAIRNAVDAVGARWGHADVLVNAAGVNRRLPVLDVTLADWDFVINTNLRSIYFMCQAVGRLMTAQRGGKIINLASTSGMRSFPDLSLYALTKAAVARLTSALAVEWAPYNVQVNAIAPGWLETPMTATMAPERRRWVDTHVPMGHFGQPRDLVGLGLVLASRASDYMTGQVYIVDGGFIAGQDWV
ncbi:MAG: SDR family NAD(P)-dependent oxidoreductase [Chloroflexota bacterium]